MSYKKWLDNIQIGDKLYQERFNWIYVNKVTAKTATGSLKFEDGDLQKLGEYWSRNNKDYQPITDEILMRINLQNKIRRLEEIFKENNLLKCSAEELDKMLAILESKITG